MTAPPIWHWLCSFQISEFWRWVIRMRRPEAYNIRLWVYLIIIVAAFTWDTTRRHWSPDLTITTEHYTIASTATPEQTEEIGEVVEIMHATYLSLLNEFGMTPLKTDLLQVKLFKNRKEFRHCNRIYGWAEAFYREPCCYQYYPKGEKNPYHWMIHEGVHQLNTEVAGIELDKWLSEGSAEYFGTSLLVSNELMLGQIDINTYPVWWLDTMDLTGNLEADKASLATIPLRAVIADSGGPDIDDHFNTYYLHWWSLTHFLMEHDNGKYRPGLAQLFRGDAGIDAFTTHIGDIEEIEKEWYLYIQRLQKELFPHLKPQ